MSDERAPHERHPTDEPDGTPAYAASLRKPGDSVTGAEAEPGADETSPDQGARYDVSAVSGDTEAYRPD